MAPNSPSQDEPSLSRPDDRAPLRRTGLVLLALAMGGTLIASVVTAHLGARRVASTLTRGQAEAFLEQARRRLRKEPPTVATLEAFLAEHEAEGLRYVALVRPDGLVGAGTIQGPRSAPRPGQLEAVGARVRAVQPMEAPGHRPPPHAAPPPAAPSPGHQPPPPRGAPPGHHPPRLLIVELEPTAARALERQAALSLVLGVAAAALFLVLALAFRRALRQRDLVERRAEQHRRLAALGEMSAVLAHELRNPLASLKGHAQLLVEALPESGRAYDKATRIVRETVRIETLTADLLAFVRSGALHVEEADPRALVRAAIDAAGDPGRFDLDLAAAPARWPLDAGRMRQVLENILRNAAQAGDGAADAADAADAAGKKVEVRMAEQDGRLIVRVRDHGPGLPPGAEDRIFEAFYTTRVRGTGLGLAIARRIVEQHGGMLTAANHPQGGAVFCISIPRAGAR